MQLWRMVPTADCMRSSGRSRGSGSNGSASPGRNRIGRRRSRTCSSHIESPTITRSRRRRAIVLFRCLWPRLHVKMLQKRQKPTKATYFDLNRTLYGMIRELLKFFKFGKTVFISLSGAPIHLVIGTIILSTGYFGITRPRLTSKLLPSA